MSLKDELNDRGYALRILPKHPDKIQIVDDDLSKLLEDQQYIREGSSQIPYPWLFISDIHRLKNELVSWEESSGLSRPQWVEEGLTESRWAYDNRSDNSRIAWKMGDTAIIHANYTLTMSRHVQSMMCLYKRSESINSWIVSDIQTNFHRLSEVLEEEEFLLSNVLEDTLEGRADWKKTLQERADSALEMGIRIPTDFESGRKLKPHQEISVLNLAYQAAMSRDLEVDDKRGSLEADQVGLGKGGSGICGALALDDYLQRQDPQSTVYPVVVCGTKSMKEELKEEIWKWKHDAVIWEMVGTKPDPVPSYLDSGEQVHFILLNVDILSARLPDILEAEPRGLVADEAHVFINDSKRTRAAIELVEALRQNTDTPYIVFMSGTPFTTRPRELWWLIFMLGWRLRILEHAWSGIDEKTMRIKTKRGIRNVPLSDRYAFDKYFCDGFSDKYGSWYNDGCSNAAELNQLLLDLGMVRRKKSDVMHPMPELTEKIVDAEISEEDRKTYEEIYTQYRQWLINKTIEMVEQRIAEGEEDLDIEEEIRSVLRKLGHEEDKFRPEFGMRQESLRGHLAIAKAPHTIEWIHRFMEGDPEITGGDPTRRKLIVFAHHKNAQMAFLEDESLQKYGVVSILSGQIQGQDTIQKNKVLFQEDDRYRLMICSSSSAREGHTLTAAKDVFLHEIPYTPTWVVQMAGRCWARFSELYEPHEATVWYSVASRTIDGKVIGKTRIRKNNFNAIIDAEERDIDESDLANEEAIDTLIRSMSIGKKDIGIAG